MNHGDNADADAEPEASSSSHSPQDRSHTEHDDDDNNPGRHDTDRNDLLSEDPLQVGLGSPISFKRKPKKRGFLEIAQSNRLFASLTGSPSDSDGGSRSGSAHGRRAQENGTPYRDNVPNSPWSPRRRGGVNGSAAKDGAPLDWYVEGPGRRVGYEDLTAIDWIFEYTKERTRLRVLRSNTQGLLGKLQLSFDSAQEWIILVATGILVGTLAAVIDITTDWLGDLKAGYCTNDDGGRFYLNKAFCCLGYDDESQCSGWHPWATALHITSTAGSYIIEYLFFLIFSVSLCSLPNFCWEKKRGGGTILMRNGRSFLLFAPAFWSRSLRCMQSTAVYPRSRLCWGGSLSGNFWECGLWLQSLLDWYGPHLLPLRSNSRVLTSVVVSSCGVRHVAR